jgi:DNA-binding transcriptional regulator YhcF (GntR family)
LKIDRYKQIAQALITDLQSGKYKKGAVLPTRSDLAKRFKTTRSTVNRAMEELISKGFLAARRGAGTVVISSEAILNIAYIAPDWLMHYIPEAADCKLKYFTYEDILCSRTSLGRLKNFDGIMWSHPEERDIPEIKRVSAGIPSILINRLKKGINSVNSEYLEFFSEYVCERLKQYSELTPYFLSCSEPTAPHRKRYEAFVKACREHKRFYENIELDKNFTSKLSKLEKALPVNENKLLIFADDWSHTGAVIFWAGKHDKRLGNDIFYTDFDNTEPQHVWGIITTSIIQDFDFLTDTALKTLLQLIKKNDVEENIFVAPELRRGDT